MSSIGFIFAVLHHMLQSFVFETFTLSQLLRTRPMTHINVIHISVKKYYKQINKCADVRTLLNYLIGLAVRLGREIAYL